MEKQKKLINANEFWNRLNNVVYDVLIDPEQAGDCAMEGYFKVTIAEVLRQTKTVDAVEVVHGRWVFGELDIMGQPVHCSVCGWGSDMVNRAMWLQYDGHKFCGNCGAKMDGGNENG